MTADDDNTSSSFFRDKEGKLTVWQKPNLPLIGWFVFMCLAWVFKGTTFYGGFSDLSRSALFVWAYLEVRSGASPFRRALGGVVLAYTVISFF